MYKELNIIALKVLQNRTIGDNKNLDSFINYEQNLVDRIKWSTLYVTIYHSITYSYLKKLGRVTLNNIQNCLVPDFLEKVIII